MKTGHYTAEEGAADLFEGEGLSEPTGHVWTSYILQLCGIYLI